MPVSPFDPAQGKPFDPAQGPRPAAGIPPADILSQKPPSSPGPGRLTGFINIPQEPLFPGLGQILFLSCVVVVVIISTFFMGVPEFLNGKPGATSQKQAGAFAPPINVADVNFPSGFQQDIFLKNFQDAAKTSDYSTRYKLLEDNYTRLLGFYGGDHDPKTRKVLEQYSVYMVNNYPDQAQKSLYTVPCFDSGCGVAKYPAQIKSIKDNVDSNTAFDSVLKENLDKNFEAAALSTDKNFQWSTYINALSSVKSIYDKNKDEVTLAVYKELADFIEKNYPDYKIPQQIRIGQ